MNHIQVEPIVYISCNDIICGNSFDSRKPEIHKSQIRGHFKSDESDMAEKKRNFCCASVILVFIPFMEIMV